MEGARGEIAKLNVSEEMRQGFRTGFDRGMERAKARLAEMLDLEAKTVDEFGKIFDLLSERKGTWAVRDGKIIFGSQADLSRFNSHLAAIDAMGQRQDALQKEGVDSANAKLDKMKN
jgi:hypothetical protein